MRSELGMGGGLDGTPRQGMSLVSPQPSFVMGVGVNQERKQSTFGKLKSLQQDVANNSGMRKDSGRFFEYDGATAQNIQI